MTPHEQLERISRFLEGRPDATVTEIVAAVPGFRAATKELLRWAERDGVVVCRDGRYRSQRAYRAEAAG